MGEAWFMGDQRRMYQALLQREVADITRGELEEALEAITSGSCSFGPLDEWTDWLHYLLPRVIAVQGHARALGDSLGSAVMAVHPQGYALTEPCTGFREDLLHTLGSLIMSDAWWPDDARASASDAITDVDWHDPDMLRLFPGGQFSCALFMCLKCLAPDEVAAWVGSVLDIGDPRWRAAFLSWLVHARPIIGAANAQPKEADHVPWEFSFMLGGHYTGNYPPASLVPFVPPANKAAFKRALQARLDANVLEAWIAPLRGVRDMFDAAPVAPAVQDVLEVLNEQ